MSCVGHSSFSHLDRHHHGHHQSPLVLNFRGPNPLQCPSGTAAPFGKGGGASATLQTYRAKVERATVPRLQPTVPKHAQQFTVNGHAVSVPSGNYDVESLLCALNRALEENAFGHLQFAMDPETASRVLLRRSSSASSDTHTIVFHGLLADALGFATPSAVLPGGEPSVLADFAVDLYGPRHLEVHLVQNGASQCVGTVAVSGKLVFYEAGGHAGGASEESVVLLTRQTVPECRLRYRARSNNQAFDYDALRQVSTVSVSVY